MVVSLLPPEEEFAEGIRRLLRACFTTSRGRAGRSCKPGKARGGGVAGGALRRRRATQHGAANPPSPSGCGGRRPSPASLLLGVPLWVRLRRRSLDLAAWRSQRGPREVVKPALTLRKKCLPPVRRQSRGSPRRRSGFRSAGASFRINLPSQFLHPGRHGHPGQALHRHPAQMGVPPTSEFSATALWPVAEARGSLTTALGPAAKGLEEELPMGKKLLDLGDPLQRAGRQPQALL